MKTLVSNCLLFEARLRSPACVQTTSNRSRKKLAQCPLAYLARKYWPPAHYVDLHRQLLASCFMLSPAPVSLAYLPPQCDNARALFCTSGTFQQFFSRPWLLLPVWRGSTGPRPCPNIFYLRIVSPASCLSDEKTLCYALLLNGYEDDQCLLLPAGEKALRRPLG